MNKQKLMSALQAELNRQFEYGAVMFCPDYMGSGQPMISYPIGHPAPRPVIDLERLADAGLDALALAPAQAVPDMEAEAVKPYAHEYGKSNGDGTYSVVIERGEPEKPVPDWPIKPLFASPLKPEDIVEALRAADAAIAEYIRYLDGGEMRGSYDGKPERNALRKAGLATRKSLAASNSGSGR
ncbi:hypothetical protein [Mesorhizobium sp.]|uniref:hypothetical protein n=1 Tax=Mesorhizobium sp. TaxID=1871066 RepID=UPI000FE5B2EE|nr:hypothetical protein [Mesorhizobium sp.]RWP29895.1 MAG: hypothetical protein EOR03_25905 [Mesorhizobium sp.]